MAVSSKKKLTDKEISQNKSDRVMETIAWRCAFYRENPVQFCEDFLGVTELKLFQKILLYAMMHYDKFYYIAARSQGKTTLVALFAVIRCILYPRELVVATSFTFKQGKEIVSKITDDFMHRSALLRNEIGKVSVGQNDCGIWFKNGSKIIVKIANQNSRGCRSTILITDEARMVPQYIIDTVLRPMNVSRQPGYLKNPEYNHLKELPKEMYLSSAWYKASEMFEKVKSYTANFLDDKMNYFICSLPYQISIAEGLMMRQIIEDEMAEATFSDISFMMEREGKFYGSSEDALFDFNVLNDRRTLQESFHDLEYYRNNNVKIPSKQNGEKRVLSLDIALLASRRHANDASCFCLEQLVPTTSNNYISNIVYVETKEGLVTEELGLMTMRYFYQYECDYLAIDANGIGQSVLDYVMSDRYDPQYGVTYGAIQTVDNDDLNERCKIKNAPKVIYAIKATAKSNNDMALALRAGFQNGNINLLVNETNIEDNLSKLVKGYNKLTPVQQARIKAPYLQTTLMIEELINLEHEISNGLVKVKERSGMRKDRYSALQYAYHISQILARNLKPKTQTTNYNEIFKIRAPKIGGRIF